MRKILKDKRFIDEEFEYIKLKKGDIKSLISHMEDIWLSDIKIVDYEYEYELSDIEEFKSLDSIEIVGYCNWTPISIYFSSHWNHIRVDIFSNELYWIVINIKQILKEYRRTYLYFFRKYGSKIILYYLLFIIFPLSWIPKSMIDEYNLNFIGYLIGLGFILFSLLLVYIDTSKIQKNIIIQDQTFLIRNGDKIILIIISAMIWSFIPIIINKL